jgi:hypothetical protein
LAFNGALKHPFVTGFGGIDIHFIQPRIVLPFVCAAIFKIAGYSIFAGRVGSLLLSILALVSLYSVMKRWFGEKQAVFIAIATILHPWFLEISRRIRPEIYYLALAMAALWCIIRSLDSGSRLFSLLAGILAGLAVLAHPSGLILDIAIFGAVLIWSRTGTIWRLVLWASLGFTIAVLPYIFYVLWSVKDPGVNFFQQMQSGLAQSSEVNNHTIITIFIDEIRRWKNFLRWPAGIPLAIIIAASWLLAWYRSDSADKILATVVALFCLILPFTTNSAGRYLAALVPFFCALMVRMIWRCAVERRVITPIRHRFCSVVGISTAVVYLLMCIAGTFLMFYRLRGADFNRVVERIASVVGREDRVYGQEVLWIGHDRYHCGPYPIDTSVRPFRQTIDMIHKYHFDYAIRSAWTFVASYGISSPPAKMPDFRSSNTIDMVCKQFGTKVAEFYDPYFGPFEIYKLNWNDYSVSKSKIDANTRH